MLTTIFPTKLGATKRQCRELNPEICLLYVVLVFLFRNHFSFLKKKKDSASDRIRTCVGISPKDLKSPPFDHSGTLAPFSCKKRINKRTIFRVLFLVTLFLQKRKSVSPYQESNLDLLVRSEVRDHYTIWAHFFGKSV